jgi:hypothetical protein
VKLGDAEESASDRAPPLDFADALAARVGAFFFARLVVLLDFFAAISSSKTSDAMTAQASESRRLKPGPVLVSGHFTARFNLPHDRLRTARPGNIRSDIRRNGDSGDE